MYACMFAMSYCLSLDRIEKDVTTSSLCQVHSGRCIGAGRVLWSAYGGGEHCPAAESGCEDHWQEETHSQRWGAAALHTDFYFLSFTVPMTTYIHKYIWTYNFNWKPIISLYSNIQNPPIPIHTYIQTYIHTHTYIDICTYKFYISNVMHTYLRTYIQTFFIHTYIHIH